MNRTSIDQSARSYRRGVIFGLTMAEVFLLLIFCLLLFLATLTQKADRLADENKNLTDIVNELKEKSDAYEQSDINYEKIIKGLRKEKERLTISNTSYAETIANLDQNPAVEQLAKLAEKLEIEQINALIENSDIASSYSASELQEIIVKAEEWDTLTNQPQLNETIIDPYIQELVAKVSVEDLELLAEGKLEPAGNKWPPIISLPEAENYSFQVGSAKLTGNFKELLDGEIISEILRTLSKYNADLIEVIGHTDQTRMGLARATNLDESALDFFESSEEIYLQAKDNAGLGYARALSVTKHLLQSPKLAGYTILPYSAAQMITPKDAINRGDSSFDRSQLRRIEIRVRRKK